MNLMITSGPSVQALSTRQRSLVHNVIVYINTYPLDNDLSGGKHYPTFEQQGQENETYSRYTKQTKGNWSRKF